MYTLKQHLIELKSLSYFKRNDMKSYAIYNNKIYNTDIVCIYICYIENLTERGFYHLLSSKYANLQYNVYLNLVTYE